MNGPQKFTRAKSQYAIYCFILLVGILFALRFSIYIFNPEIIPLQRALKFTTLGLACDLSPFIVFMVLHYFCNIRTKILTNTYIIVLVLYYLVNFIFISQSSQIVSSDMIIATYYNIVPYFLLSPIKNTILILAALCFIYLTFILSKQIYESEQKAIRTCLALLLPCLIFSNIYYQHVKHVKLYQNFFRGEWVARPIYENLTFIVTDFHSYISAKDETADVSRAIASNKRQPSSCYFKNIIVIAVESLDSNYLHSVNKSIPKECTSGLDSIKSTSVFFSNYFTSAQPTVYGIHSILASRVDYNYDNVGIPSLFDVLNQHGVETYFLSGIAGYYGNQGKTFANRYRPSFSYFAEYFEKKYKIKSSGWGVDSSILFEETIELLNKDTSKEKFIMISTIDTHPPYGKVPAPEDVCMKNNEIEKSPFLLSLCALDRKISFLTQKIREIKEPTLLVITADHSATHGENYTKRSNFDPDRIPLILASNVDVTPFFAKKEYANYCSQIDLAPTILNLCSIAPPKSFMGKQITKQINSYRKISNSIVTIEDGNNQKTVSIETIR